MKSPGSQGDTLGRWAAAERLRTAGSETRVGCPGGGELRDIHPARRCRYGQVNFAVGLDDHAFDAGPAGKAERDDARARPISCVEPPGSVVPEQLGRATDKGRD